jgi:hypothetical protein
MYAWTRSSRRLQNILPANLYKHAYVDYSSYRRIELYYFLRFCTKIFQEKLANNSPQNIYSSDQVPQLLDLNPASVAEIVTIAVESVLSFARMVSIPPVKFAILSQ